MREEKDQPSALQHAISALRSARTVLAITGAGISKDAGLPTYRGTGGLYEGGKTADDIPIEVALSGHMLLKRPEVAWNHISQIEKACRGVEPSAGHRALKDLEQHCQLTVLTQNIDGLHHKAGSSDVIEIHGNVYRLRCDGCGYQTQLDDYRSLETLPPPCPHCSGSLRPDVVLFGEMLPTKAIDRYYAALAGEPDVVLSIGTTSVFPYIAGPVEEARQRGGTAIEINPGKTEVSHACDIRLGVTAAETLPAIVAGLA